MKILQRIHLILSANINDLLDRVEDPRKLLEQAIREMEDTIHSAKQHAARVLASEKLLIRQIARHEAAAEDWHEQARICVQRDDESAARTALTQRRDQLAQATALQDQQREAAQAGEQLRHQIDAMQMRLNEARRRLTTLTIRQEAAQARRSLAGLNCRSANADSAYSLFERLANRVDRAEAEADAWQALNGFDPEASHRPALRPETDPSIDRELVALRAESGGV